jgi:hypothetical protein
MIFFEVQDLKNPAAYSTGRVTQLCIFKKY